MVVLPVAALLVCQAGPPVESPIPPRWELEPPRDYYRTGRLPYSPPPELAALFPPAESLGDKCSLRPVPNDGGHPTNPAFYSPFDPACVSIRATQSIPVAGCGLAFYVSDTGGMSAVVGHTLPTGEAAEDARKAIASRYPDMTVVAIGTVVAYVLDEGTVCGKALERAVAAASP